MRDKFQRFMQGRYGADELCRFLTALGLILIVVNLFVSVLACLLLVLACNWMINNLVLEKYYRQQKQNSLVEVYNRVNSLFENGAEGDLQLNLDIISSGGNYNMILFSDQLFY